MQRRINCDGLLDCIFLGCDGGLLACFWYLLFLSTLKVGEMLSSLCW
jgi:hypothetical protein